jgi:hypothetical protein
MQQIFLEHSLLRCVMVYQGVMVFGDDSAQEDCNRDTERKIGHTLLSSVPKRR